MNAFFHVSPAKTSAGRLRLAVCITGVAMGGLSLPTPAHGTSAPIGASAADARTLSNERTITYWAHSVGRAAVRSAPASSSPAVARLRLDTEDGYPEVYLALRSAVGAGGRVWIQVRLPMRPNGRTGWVPREALASMRLVTTQLQIDRRRLRATLYRGGRRVWSAPVGVGKASSPTPAGRFWIRERLKGLGGGTVYGPLAFGTSAYSRLSDWPGGGVVGIHGTNQPGLIPGRPSHGCVRIRNPDILRLGRLMPVGTPVLIR